MTKMTQQEAAKAISDLIKQAQELVNQAESIADENDVSFSVNFGGYGMGGYYDPNDKEDQWGNDNGGWHASSQGC